jgi:ribonuclease BN (tRNA processing enzyme)
MKLIVLGSGTCVPSLTRNAPGYFLAAGGRRMLIDIGSTTLQQLTKADIPYLEIDVIFITHSHPDHVSGLLPFMHALTSTPGETRTKELFIIGPPDIENFYGCCIGSVMQPPTTFLVTISTMQDRLILGPLQILSTQTAHTAASLAYRFSEGGRSIVFTGDCDFDKKLIVFSRAADLLVVDCSFPDNMKTPGHMIPKECGEVARGAGVKKVLLTHIYPTGGPDNLRVDECAAVYTGEVLLARDLMEIDIE